MPVEVETCYRIQKGVIVWLVIDNIDHSTTVQKSMVYLVDDIKSESSIEYHFKLPWPNKKRARWLIVKKEDVIEFERIRL